MKALSVQLYVVQSVISMQKRRLTMSIRTYKITMISSLSHLLACHHFQPYPRRNPNDLRQLPERTERQQRTNQMPRIMTTRNRIRCHLFAIRIYGVESRNIDWNLESSLQTLVIDSGIQWSGNLHTRNSYSILYRICRFIVQISGREFSFGKLTNPNFEQTTTENHAELRNVRLSLMSA